MRQTVLKDVFEYLEKNVNKDRRWHRVMSYVQQKHRGILPLSMSAIASALNSSESARYLRDGARLEFVRYTSSGKWARGRQQIIFPVSDTKLNFNGLHLCLVK